MKNNLNEKIPKVRDLEEYKNNSFIDSPLVEITEDLGIAIDLQYPKMGFSNSIDKVYVRKEVLDKLLIAKSFLPEGITFKIWDSYRTFALQEELYNVYKGKIIDEFHLERINDLERKQIINKYVSIPIDDINHPPLHTTGGALDLTLIDTVTLEELDMGTKFDEFTKKTSTIFFEEDDANIEIKNNRRILYNAMTKAGFTNLPSEWWHYDYGNRAWAFYKNKDAIYNGIFYLDKE